MRTFPNLLACIGFVIQVSTVTAEVDPIVVKGSYFLFKTNGTAFFVRVIIYEPFEYDSSGIITVPDPLADGPTCRRDIQYLSSLNINVLTVGIVDSDRDHSECMNAFSEAGIYIVARISGSGPTLGWDQQTLKQHIDIIDSLGHYTNLLGLRMIIDEQKPVDLLFSRAAIRDMRAYMTEAGYRSIPIFLSEKKESKDSINYMWCHDDTPDALSLWITPKDSLCYTVQDLDAAADFSRSITMPKVWDGLCCRTEYGHPDNRSYEFISSVYSRNARQSLSGAFIYSYYTWYNGDFTESLMTWNEESDKLNDVRPLPGYSALSSVLATVKASSSEEASYLPTTTLQSCPTDTAWAFSTVLPPRPYEPLCSCMLDTLRCTARLNAIETLSDDAFNTTLNHACEDNLEKNCKGIAVDTRSGQYGAFSMCNRTTVYSWVANQYWKRHTKCDLNGTAELREIQPKPDGGCKFLMDQVEATGEKTLTAFLGTTTKTSGPQETERTGGTASNGSSESGLSRGAKAGIGVGIPVFAAICVISGFLLLKRKRRTNAALQTQADLPEYLPPHKVTPEPNTRHDLPEVQTLLRP